jgi:stearoyl-CoA desaturase (delta-9 desaturase)
MSYVAPFAGSPWWVPVLYIAVLGHITNVCITLYLHRSATHGGVRYHPIAEHFMRFWLWLTTGVITREWVAVHRKHHAFSDRPGDPHSPQEEGLFAILFGGLWFYREAAHDKETLEKYGKGCPDDWVERNVYTPHNGWGILTMLVLAMLLFGPLVGLAVWSGMALWLPIFGQIINAIGHAMGYRNFGTKDHSHNIYPFGIWIVGEELHNNHHADPRSAKFKAEWWEFDIGWMYIKMLSFVGLADVVYARSVSAKEFAKQYYQDSVAEPVAAAVDRASARVAQVRSDAIGAMDRLAGDARGELEQAMASVERTLADARASFLAARSRMEELMADSRTDNNGPSRFERTLTDARRALEESRIRLEQAHANAIAAMERAMAQPVEVRIASKP